MGDFGLKLHGHHAALLTDRASLQRATRQLFVSVTIVLGWLRFARGLVGRSHTQELTALEIAGAS
jgi:hypothetical protein